MVTEDFLSTNGEEKTAKDAADTPGIYIAVGSNIDPERHILAALEALSGRVRVVESSTFYSTDPVGAPGTPRFYNGVWRIETKTKPRPLKQEVLRQVETDLGRNRSDYKNAPRIIDLDLILYGARVMDGADLTLPDPDIYTRPFVAAPLAELCPDGILPDSGTRIGDLEIATPGDAMEALSTFTSHLKRIIHHERKTHR